MLNFRPAVLLAALATLLFILPTTAAAGPPGKWTKVTTAVPNLTEVGLARSADKKLHVLWVRDETGLPISVQHSVISANAKSVSRPHHVMTYPYGGNHSADVLVEPDGSLRAFFSGLFDSASNPLHGPLASSVSTDGGTTWGPATPVSNNTGPLSPVYASGGISAAYDLTGLPVTVWGSPGAGYHFGLSPTDADQSYSTGSTIYKPGVAVDSRNGTTMIAWQFLGSSQGTAWQTVAPFGEQVVARGAKATETNTRTAVSGRIGATGIFLAYQYGTQQFRATPAVINTTTRKVIRFAREKGAQSIGLVPAPDGRMWLFWRTNVSLGTTISATRSNKRMTRFGPITRLKAPRGARSIYNLAGEASTGPLDLVALIGTKPGNNEWHQRVLPRLTIKCSPRRARAVCKVTDAGDAVRSARVKIGRRSARTNARGQATVRAPRGNRRATATRTGHKSASTRVRVR